MPDADPWYWTVDEVACWARHDLPASFNTLPNNQLPDPEAFGNVLLEEGVSGMTLLSDVGTDFLKHDCGIAKLGGRSAVLHAIRRLQKTSPAYCRENGVPLATPRPSTPPLAQISTPPAETSTISPRKRRPDEVLVEDAQGRKRRRLDLGAVIQKAGTLSDNVESKSPGPSGDRTDTTLRSPQRSVLAETSHLPKHRMSLDDVIYGTTPVGKPTLPEMEDQSHNTSSEVFTFTAASLQLQGSRLFVQRQMRFLFQSSTQSKIKKNGKEHVTFMPYDAARLSKGQEASFTVFEGLNEGDAAVRATRQDPDLDSSGAPTNNAHPGDAGDWDYLLSKYRQEEDDTILPAIGESGEDSEVDSEAEAEIDEEAEAESSKKFTAEDAEAVFDDVVQAYRDHWAEKALPKLEQSRAYKTWQSVRKSGAEHKRLASINKARAASLNERLLKLRRDILQNQYFNEDDLVRQCGSIQATVEDLQELEWERSIWMRASPPPRPERSTVTPKVKHADLPSPAQIPDMDEETTDFITDQEAQIGDQASPDLLSEHTLPGSSPPPLPDYMDLDLQDAAAKSDSDMSFLPSDATRNSGLVIPKREPSSPKMGRHTSKDDPIVILSSDPAEQPTMPKPKAAVSQFDDNPEEASREEIFGWDMALLMEQRDRKRIVSKVILTLDYTLKEQMATKLKGERRPEKWIVDGVRKVLDQKAGRTDVYAGLEAVLFTKLYACWFQMDPSHWDYRVPEAMYNNINEFDLKAWAKYTALVLPRIAKFMEPGDTLELGSSSDEDSEPIVRRVRSRPKDIVAENNRSQAIMRMKKAEESQQTSDQMALSQMLPGSDDTPDEVTINTLREDDEVPINLNPTIAKKVKPHQIDGIRFIWREVMAEGNEGCILAHTMGLGKTCQAISFLVTLQEAGEDERTKRQIPKPLRKLRALILCPPAVLPNWLKEIDMWSPKRKFFNVYKIDATGNDQQERLDVLRQWNETGGILVMGYTMFQKYVLLKDEADDHGDEDGAAAESTETESAPGHGTRVSSINKLSQQDRILATKILREKANIIIADEAHALKNEKSKISRAAAKLKGIRIALSGTPLSNSTAEIFALVNWVAPNYLGSKSDFEADFGKPIEEGTYHDATYYAKRKSLKKLAILKTQTEPKIHRRDIMALKGSLTTKIEYNLTIPPTDLQTKIYDQYVDFVRGEFGEKEVTQIQLFGWISLLVLLVTHPKALRNKLLEKPKPKKKKSPKPDTTATLPSAEDDSDQSIVGDEEVTQLGLTPAMTEQLLSMIPTDADVSASYRMVLIKQILELARRAKDKTLVFSHRLPILDCMEELLNKMKITWARIDGSMTGPKREAVLNRFREGEYDVLLVSTRAGGQGLNMQDANRVIIVDFGYNPTWEEQAVGRAYRLGQKKDVFVYRFVTGGTFEDKLYNMGLFKSSLFQRVVDKKNPERHAKRHMKDWLFSPRPVPQGDIDEDAVKDTQVLDRIIKAQTNGGDPFIRGIKTMETLQRDAEDEPLTVEEQRECDEEISRYTRFRKNPGTALRVPPSSTAPSVQLPGRPPSTIRADATSAASGLAAPASTAPVRHPNPGASPFFPSTQGPQPAGSPPRPDWQANGPHNPIFSFAQMQNGSVPPAMPQRPFVHCNPGDARSAIQSQATGVRPSPNGSIPRAGLSHNPHPQPRPSPSAAVRVLKSPVAQGNASPEKTPSQYPSFGRSMSRPQSTNPFKTPPTHNAQLPGPSAGSPSRGTPRQQPPVRTPENMSRPPRILDPIVKPTTPR
ncbi:hypothetical protein BDZ85DRAFT_94018 [Elsinoe ampelina]|uniref:P-loop containing nucleoside triphosphate hydrolase protein n=1 Tax=Elsinoe ampelina TaxID=302913 RepID=A0A6A6FYA9_9PEZI|nr:hypothetical protein BDZ85DRAFT_94018 [Elsinoe ampelina]